MSTLRAHLAALRARFGKQVFQLSVIAVLGGTMLWGHKNHWQLSSAHADTNHDAATAHADQGAKVVKVPAAAAESSKDAPLADGAAPAAKAAPGSVRIQFPEAKSIADLGITIEGAKQRPLARKVDAPANVVYEPSRHAQLSVRVSGTVWRIEKHLGEEIHAGEVLAIIDSPALGEAKADFLHSIADVQLTQAVYSPLQSFAKGEVSGRQVRTAETELRKAKVDLFNASQALVSFGLPIDMEECQGLPEVELQKRVKFLGLPETLVTRFNPDSTSASLLPIHAPFDGLVIGRDLSIGEVVSPGQTYFEIADVRRMWILLNVREQDSDNLEIGQSVSFTAGSASATGKISWMSTAVDPKTRTVEVRCEVENPEILKPNGESTGKRVLRANLFGVGTVELASNPAALSVPTKAVQWDGEGHVVFVKVDDQSFEPRRVRLGIVTDEFSEIVENLVIDEPVAVDGSHILKAELTRSAMSSSP